MIFRLFLFIYFPVLLLASEKVYIGMRQKVVVMDPVLSTVTSNFRPSFGGVLAGNLTGVAISYDQKTAYIADNTNLGVWIINISDDTTSGYIKLPSGANAPYEVVVTPHQTKLYVSDTTRSKFYSIDLSDQTVSTIDYVDTNVDTAGMAVNASGTKLYITGISNFTNQANIEVYSTHDDTWIKSIPATTGSAVAINKFGVGYFPSGSSGKIYIFDTDTDTVTKTIGTGQEGLSGVGFSSDGTIAYVGSSDNKLVVVTNEVVGDKISVNFEPGLVRVDPDNENTIYGTWALGDNTIMIITIGSTITPPTFDFLFAVGIGFIREERSLPITSLAGRVAYNRFPFQTDVIYDFTWDYNASSSTSILEGFIIYRDGVEILRTPARNFMDHNQVAMESYVYLIQPYYTNGSVGVSSTIVFPN